jgi:hypothetical protein
MGLMLFVEYHKSDYKEKDLQLLAVHNRMDIATADHLDNLHGVYQGLVSSIVCCSTASTFSESVCSKLSEAHLT